VSLLAQPPWLDEPLVARSLEVIRDGQAPGGAFIAGPTFSQYRYAWLRDGAFIAEGLDLAGETGMAARFHDWVASVVLASAAGIERSIAAVAAGRAPDPQDYLHCRYNPDGTLGPEDWPTFQLDGPGIWLWSLAHHARCGGTLTATHRQAAALAGRYLAGLWATPSNDAWEEFPDRLHTSTAAAVLAGLRALDAVAPDARDAAVADARRRLERLLVERAEPYTKWEGSDAVDASLLWICAPYRLVGAEHPAFAATLARIEADLVSPDGGVYRYAADTYYGGGEWILLTAALGRVYLRRAADGDVERAVACRRWIERQASPDGHLPEQVDGLARHREWVDPWRADWGESASPLLWSHAAYLALRADLAAAGAA
jgi:GH15 family glucan-1,4-alpha-glucosidase